MNDSELNRSGNVLFVIIIMFVIITFVLITVTLR